MVRVPGIAATTGGKPQHRKQLWQCPPRRHTRTSPREKGPQAERKACTQHVASHHDGCESNLRELGGRRSLLRAPRWRLHICCCRLVEGHALAINEPHGAEGVAPTPDAQMRSRASMPETMDPRIQACSRHLMPELADSHLHGLPKPGAGPKTCQLILTRKVTGKRWSIRVPGITVYHRRLAGLSG